MNSNTSAKTLELFFIDGKPDGMLTAEVFNWTGHVLMAPRTQLAAALKRQEAVYTGVYVLLGDHEGEFTLYVGEGEDIGERIKNHDANKTWWTTAILIVASGDALNKAHAKYLEARLIQIAKNVGKAKVSNSAVPALTSLSEAQAANMEGFLEYILIVLPALRVDAFLQNTRPPVVLPTKISAPATAPGSVLFELKTPKHGIEGAARLTNGEFIVQANSKARLKWEGTPSHTYASLYADLVKAGVLIEDGSHRRFATDYVFTSPSAAAAVLNGRASNGQEAGKLSGTQTTYRGWEAIQLRLA